MRPTTDNADALYRRVLRLHINSVTRESDLVSPLDLRSAPSVLVVLWLSILVGLLVIIKLAG